MPELEKLELQELKVIEVLNSSSVYLGTEPENRGKVVRSSLRIAPRPRELDDYRLAGVYEKARVPVAITEVQVFEKNLPAEEKGYQVLTRAVSRAVSIGICDRQAVFVTGGTCVLAPGVAGGLRRAYGRDARIGIIWLDAHGDLNTPETSPSGMLGGMPFATVLGLCLEDWREDCGLVPPLDANLALLSDARSFDKEEAENIKNLGLTVMNTADFCDLEKWQEEVQKLAAKVDILYLHIDADIIDGRFVPSVNTPEPNGPDTVVLLHNIRSVMATGKVAAVTLASIYFAPKPGAEEMNIGQEAATLTGIRMIGTILGNWKTLPKSPGWMY